MYGLLIRETRLYRREPYFINVMNNASKTKSVDYCVKNTADDVTDDAKYSLL